FVGLEGCVPLLEGVGDVLQEDQAEHDVLVLGRVHMPSEFIGRSPELLLETEVRPVDVWLPSRQLRLWPRHAASVKWMPPLQIARAQAVCQFFDTGRRQPVMIPADKLPEMQLGMTEMVRPC